jgi:predicted NAD/FAD-binding protein
LKRIAIIGAGISGLAAARQLARGAHRVTLYEAGSHFGGHAHTVDVTLGGVSHGVDTGFLVYNERTYPRLVRLFAELGVEVAKSDMSFSVQVPGRNIEWGGRNLASVFAQPGNLLRPAFWRMLSDLSRFNSLATQLAQEDGLDRLDQPIGAFLDEHRFSDEFRTWYLLPMIACIWSCPTAQMLEFPVATLIRFCHNHGLLQVTNRPQWWTVRGGSREYVRRIVAALPDARLGTPVRRVTRLDAGVLVATDDATALYDEVVLACHSDQALRLLGDNITAPEAQLLGAIRYQSNRAVLHTDTSLLPARRAAWAAWNYESGNGASASTGSDRVCLHYLLNQLQPLPWQQPVIVSLNPVREPDAAQVVRAFDYAHPVFDRQAIEAQRRLPSIQGLRRTWFCGAWTGYGFHEDGLASGLAVADAIANEIADTKASAATMALRSAA